MTASTSHGTFGQDTSAHATVAEIAADYGLSVEVVRKYIRSGKIPPEMVDRSGGVTTISRTGFAELLRCGFLFRHGSKHQRVFIADDNTTTRRDGDGYRHRWIGGDGRNVVAHPWRAR